MFPKTPRVLGTCKSGIKEKEIVLRPLGQQQYGFKYHFVKILNKQVNAHVCIVVIFKYCLINNGGCRFPATNLRIKKLNPHGRMLHYNF